MQVQPSVADDDRLMSLVDAAMAQPPGEREQYLRRLCGGDPELFEQARDYVESEERMGGFLLKPFCTLEVFNPVLEPGEVLEGRFRIERQVGEGGMAIVYEAFDETLKKRIAVKCAKPGFEARLTPEAGHATQVAHDNVCKIFDFHSAGRGRGEIDFITMEFLYGRTLTERLAEGPLPEREARAIGRQICAGLAAAHRNNVIHGDLKSNNIILTKAADGSLRAVITDFGLARRIQPQPEGPYPGESGSAVGGAPDYMAPELQNGEKSSVASDIYALGVICREMLTGTRACVKPLRAHSKWDGILARCLAKDPVRRYGRVEEIEQALAPFAWPVVLAAVAAAVLAAATGMVTYLRTATPPETVRLAVLPFETSAENRALADGLLDDAAEHLRRVRDSKNQKVTIISLADAVRNKVDKPEKAAKVLGATHVLTGTLRLDRGHILVHADLADARSHIPVKEWEAEYQPGRLRELPIALAGVVTGTLHLPALTALATVNSAAYPDFTRGVGLLQRNMADGALPLLESAVKADPDSPLTHARLAEAQLQKYQVTNEERWLNQAILSFGSARQRNPDVAEVWLVSATINEFIGAYETARDDVRRALDIEPRNGEGWRHLGRIYQESDRFADALVAYQKGLEVQPGHFTNYEGLCSLFSDLGKYEEGIPQCLKLVALAPDFSEAHLTLANAYGNWGHYTEAENESRVALSLDPSSSRAFHLLAVALTYELKYDEAISNFQRALETGSATHLLYLNLGITLQWAGRQTEAREAYRKGLSLAKAVLANNSRDGNVRARLAYLYAQLGERDQAQDAATIARQVSGGSANVLYWLVRTYLALGDRDRATALAEDAPNETLHRLSRQPDLAELFSNPRLQKLMQSPSH
jgi:tetratricopeptide (TPR) repeat protein/TolB-like protein